MRKSAGFLAIPVLALLIAACGSSSKKPSATTPAPASSTPSANPYGTSASSTSSSGAATKVSSAKVSGLGTVLVNGSGQALYIFKPDNAKKVTCTGPCASVWPPLKLSGSKAAATGAVKASLLGSDPDPSGGKVVTYAGWPLYTYVADSSPGTANGQAKNLNGGLWYAMSPTGAVVKKTP